MGLYSLDLDGLAAFSNTSVEDLKTHTYADLEKQIKDMKRAKFLETTRQNAQDKEFKRLVLTYFEPFDLLSHWFSEQEIVHACAVTGVTKSDLCKEHPIERGRALPHRNAEYLRTSVEALPRYTRSGEELMNKAHVMCDVYRIRNPYQGLCHGRVIQDLLYERYPELEKFGFSAYGMDNAALYELYPKNNIYVPFAALMSGNIDHIIWRNRNYAQNCNAGEFTPFALESRLRQNDVREMFDTIYKIGESEIEERHHMPYYFTDAGAVVAANGFITTALSGPVMKLSRRDSDQCFQLLMSEDCTPLRVLKEFRKMVPSAAITVAVAHKTDHLLNHAVTFEHCDLSKLEQHRVSRFTVKSAYGMRLSGSAYKLILRIDCPDLMQQ